MSSVREVVSWQDAYIFCLQPNFQDDLWLFMIFAAIQVSLAGLKLTSFFINRWARSSKVGSGDDDEDNVGDDGASGGISIMGVLTLIAGALILTAYCDNEPDEKTFNIFKAGVYLNTFLFAVALIFICGLVVAFVIDILTRRRGRSITFRMFLGGTIVLSIAASFFGATGLMGLKYIQDECYDEVDLYNKLGSSAYLELEKHFADEDFETVLKSSNGGELTKEYFYEIYGEKIIGEPLILSEELYPADTVYIYSVIYNNTDLSRKSILNKKMSTVKYVYDEEDRLKSIAISLTEAGCFDTVGGFDEIQSLLTCGFRNINPAQEYAFYEEAEKVIVDRNQCAHKEEELKCDQNSESFPLCCSQFEFEYTKGEDCRCINAIDDASCKFDATKDCEYKENTLDFKISAEKSYYCDKYGDDSEGWCKTDSQGANIWMSECADKATDNEKYDCCQSNVFRKNLDQRVWFNVGEKEIIPMTPTTCVNFESCRTADDFIGGCCSTASNTDCQTCKSDDDGSDAVVRAAKCGYTECITSSIQEKMQCCKEVQSIYGSIFKTGSTCYEALNYNPCDSTKSLGCAATNTDCNKNKDCFPTCCENTSFDFADSTTIAASIASDCFQRASEYIGAIHDTDKLLGQYIYHETGQSDRDSCKKVGGIIDPKCCNSKYEYDDEDPCYCHGATSDATEAAKQSIKCKKVHHSDCYPGAEFKSNGGLVDSTPYPQCCFDIGDFFGQNHSCACRLQKNLNGETPSCNKFEVSTIQFDYIETCPNPCTGNKALLSDGSHICQTPVYTL